MSTQIGWRWCHKCQGFFFSGGPSQGVCPATGSHDASQSGHYAALFGDGILPVSESVTTQPPGFFPAAFSISSPFAGAAVMGESTSQGAGVFGISMNGIGVSGTGNTGVYGSSDHGEGVHAEAKGNVAAVAAFNLDPGQGQGVWAHSDHGEGVHGETNSPTFAAVAGTMLNPNGTGAGVYGESRGKGPAGWFQGNVTITGNLTANGDIFLPGADCAEQFDITGAQKLDPGTVVVIDRDGALRESQEAYDKKVAGVISGAGGYSPGIVLDKRPSEEGRAAVALVGKVCCKVDAQYAPIEVGNLLTSSPTLGHAMKAEDPLKAFGAVIGKAMRPLRSGRGLIPILIALQ